jgi:DNA repair exonuclease SbcCD nuclease subunit
MKFLVTGDLHLTNKTPTNRIDDYAQTVCGKFNFLFECAKKYNCEAILQPGDFTDSPSLPYSFFVEILSVIKRHNIPIFLTWGQHDLRFRNRENTFLMALYEACPQVHTVSKDTSPQRFGDCFIYGSAWEEDIPEIIKPSEFNILITHRMIVKEKLWEGQTDFVAANSFLRTNKFSLIVSGDNHTSFYYKIGNKELYNLGSMTRSTSTQLNHRPCVAVYDTEKLSGEIIYIPIKKSEEVFMIEKINREKEKNEELSAFVKGLAEHKDASLSFIDNLKEYLKINKIEESIEKIIKESFRERDN